MKETFNANNLDLDLGSGHTHRSLPTHQISFESENLWTDGQTSSPALSGRLREVDLKMTVCVRGQTRDTNKIVKVLRSINMAMLAPVTINQAK